MKKDPYAILCEDLSSQNVVMYLRIYSLCTKPKLSITLNY